MKCLHCQGRGKRMRIVGRATVSEPWYIWQPCTHCKGTGRSLIQMSAGIVPSLVRQPSFERALTLRTKHKTILF